MTTIPAVAIPTREVTAHECSEYRALAQELVDAFVTLCRLNLREAAMIEQLEQDGADVSTLKRISVSRMTGDANTSGSQADKFLRAAGSARYRTPWHITPEQTHG